MIDPNKKPNGIDIYPKKKQADKIINTTNWTAITTINDLLIEIQPATLMTILGEQITVKDRDISRAEYIRNKLNW